MTEHEIRNAASFAEDHGVELERKAVKLQKRSCQNRRGRATHFWDPHSNSIAPIPSSGGREMSVYQAIRKTTHIPSFGGRNQ